MNELGIREEHQIKVGAFTEKEIWGQPSLWKQIYEQVRDEKQAILAFLENTRKHKNLNIILTGAGTSAFIGLSLTGVYNRNLLRQTIAISTTDLVTHPHDYLIADIPVLLISFARSGNSPESIAAARLVDKVCRKVYHLIITCDAAGDLAHYKTDAPKYVFILPAEANDQSLAMTGSYSGMLLAGLLMARIKEIEILGIQIKKLQEYALKLLSLSETFRELAETNFERAVFLGSGPLFGTATESQLKIQELTDGRVISKNDTFLGFRHGPKSVIDHKTLVFLLFSNQSYVLPYELDLMVALKNGQKPLYIAGIHESGPLLEQLDKEFVLSNEGNQLDEEFLPVCFILPAQMIGFFKSIQLGLNPDMPSASGAISRVVEGVVIYPYQN
jgi:tagatose-6-phosphate ketose/aldose isomerase